jgi:hypothetical protein
MGSGPSVGNGAGTEVAVGIRIGIGQCVKGGQVYRRQYARQWVGCL